MNRIPHIIHYCWFGGKPLPESAQKYIGSWKRYFPGWEIRRCDESNFDVNACLYTRQAYEKGKYAFVSDYARFKLLYDHGGVYFDTDVEVIADFGDILSAGPFLGYETDPGTDDSPYGTVNPGLCMGAEQGMDFYRQMLEYYNSIAFLDENGEQLPGTVVAHTTEVMRCNGLAPELSPQSVCGITIWPRCRFNPLDDATGLLKITPETRSIHWYAKTWTGMSSRRIAAARLLHRIFGIGFSQKLKKLLHLIQ